jgi:hypothetical protein
MTAACGNRRCWSWKAGSRARPSRAGVRRRELDAGSRRALRDHITGLLSVPAATLWFTEIWLDQLTAGAIYRDWPGSRSRESSLEV